MKRTDHMHLEYTVHFLRQRSFDDIQVSDLIAHDVHYHICMQPSSSICIYGVMWTSKYSDWSIGNDIDEGLKPDSLGPDPPL